MDKQKFAEAIYSITTPFHYVEYARKRLLENGFSEVKESDDDHPDRFFTVRDERCIVAVKMGDTSHGLILSAHDDSPCYKAKPNFSHNDAGFNTAKISKYGSPTASVWIDRDLRIAGRALIVDSDGKTSTKLFATNYPVGHIASQAYDLNHSSDLQPKFNSATHFLPIVSGDLHSIIAEELKIEKDQIQAADIFFIDAQEPSFVGTDESLFCSARIDDLSSAICSLDAFLKADSKYVTILAIFDNEEIGSNTVCGAQSNFLKLMLNKISKKDSFPKNCICLSLDNNHGRHPNFPEKTPEETIRLGDGPCISYDPNLLFSSELRTNTIVKEIAKQAGINVAIYYDLNTHRGGTTFGPFISSSLGIPCIDLGIPVLGMHSIRETCCFSDIVDFHKLCIEIIQRIQNYY